MLQIALRTSTSIMFTDWRSGSGVVIVTILMVALASIIGITTFSLSALLIAYASTFVLLTVIFIAGLYWLEGIRTEQDLKDLPFLIAAWAILSVASFLSSEEERRRGW